MISGHERKARSGNTKQLVVILHGWGADGANLIDLADFWAPMLPDAHFCAPNAHEICEVNPYGFQWFSLMDRSPSAMVAGVTSAAKVVNEFLDAKLDEIRSYVSGEASRPSESSASEAASQASDSMSRSGDKIKLTLVGFSQGTMTALHVGLRRADVSCILGYSGALLEDEQTLQALVKIKSEASRANAPAASEAASHARAGGERGDKTIFPPVCLIHGEADDVVPFASMARAEQLLKSNGINLETHKRPNLGHSIDMQGLEIGGRFLKEKLG